MLNERLDWNREKGPGSSESDITSTVNVRPAHLPSGVEKRRELRKADLTTAILARFSSAPTIQRGSCVLWLGFSDPSGYGVISDYPRRNQKAHRIAYVLAKGTIPASRVVMHACDTPACINPDHLSLGTDQDNIRDCVQKGRTSRGKPRQNCRRLWDEDVVAIRQSTEPTKTLCLRYGVSTRTIQNVRAGRARFAVVA